MATLNRYRFDRHSEQLDVMQRSLLDESIDADIEAIALEIEALKPPSVPRLKDKLRRAALPASFPRQYILNEPENTQRTAAVISDTVSARPGDPDQPVREQLFL